MQVAGIAAMMEEEVSACHGLARPGSHLHPACQLALELRQPDYTDVALVACRLTAPWT